MAFLGETRFHVQLDRSANAIVERKSYDGIALIQLVFRCYKPDLLPLSSFCLPHH